MNDSNAQAIETLQTYASIQTFIVAIVSGLMLINLITLYYYLNPKTKHYKVRKELFTCLIIFCLFTCFSGIFFGLNLIDETIDQQTCVVYSKIYSSTYAIAQLTSYFFLFIKGKVTGDKSMTSDSTYLLLIKILPIVLIGSFLLPIIVAIFYSGQIVVANGRNYCITNTPEEFYIVFICFIILDSSLTIALLYLFVNHWWII